jgi:excisionase family DNA binding protein
MALLAMARRATGADIVLFGVKGPERWQMVCHGQQGAVPAATSDCRPIQAPTSPLGASRYEPLLRAVVESGAPTEFTRHSLATICPSLVDAGMARVVGAPVHGPSGTVSAVLVVGYRGHPAADHLVLAGSRPTWAGTETVVCMGKLLAMAQGHLASLSPPSTGPHPAGPYGANDPRSGGPDDFLLSREVAAIFAVSPRTVTNWATHGMLPAARTAGGHLRFRRRDVVALYEHQLAERPPSEAPVPFDRSQLAAVV